MAKAKGSAVSAADVSDDIETLDGLIDGDEGDALGSVLAPIRDRLKALLASLPIRGGA